MFTLLLRHYSRFTVKLNILFTLSIMLIWFGDFMLLSVFADKPVSLTFDNYRLRLQLYQQNKLTGFTSDNLFIC